MTDWATAKYDIERFLDIDIEAERAKEQDTVSVSEQQVDQLYF